MLGICLHWWLFINSLPMATAYCCLLPPLSLFHVMTHRVCGVTFPLFITSATDLTRKPGPTFLTLCAFELSRKTRVCCRCHSQCTKFHQWQATIIVYFPTKLKLKKKKEKKRREEGRPRSWWKWVIRKSFFLFYQ